MSFALNNVVNGNLVPVQECSLNMPRFRVHNPATGELLCEFTETHAGTIEEVLQHAHETAIGTWSRSTWKSRAQIMHTFRHLCLTKYKSELVDLIVLENGKHKTDALASLLKGLEVVEYAVSPSIGSGYIQEVSSGVYCQDRKDPLGVVLSICPFNFPAMVPLWTVPILVVCGNVVVIKPSEKVPFTVTKLVEIMTEAGLPRGVVSVVHGGRCTVESLIRNPIVKGVTFVGSTPVAKSVYDLSVSLSKRAICLGGAKNHLVVMPDADFEQSATDILNSFAGSAGQRCMAASVLVLVTQAARGVMTGLLEKARKVKPGQTLPGQIGPLIDQAAVQRVTKYIDASENSFGGKALLDGRSWNSSTGFWIGPTIIEHEGCTSADPALYEEIFGPVLTVITVDSLSDAVQHINTNQFGNAACIYTRSGPHADYFTKNVNVGMMGVNIGVPVPREPFSFGGTKMSKFGIGDITGDGLVEFCTVRRKITTKWGVVEEHKGDFVSKNFTG